MLGSRKLTVFLTLLLVVTAARPIATFTKSDPRSIKSAQERTDLNYKHQFPVVDYDAPEPANLNERNMRRAKSARYDRRTLVSKDPTPRVTEIATVKEGPETPPLPIDQSAIVIIGKTLDARAFLSNDKENVYSEFTFRVDEVLKKQPSSSVLPGSTIVAEREGGVVRYSNGHERLYRVMGQGMPMFGKQYLAFLRAAPNGCDYDILAAYELREADVLPIDDSRQFQQYKGTEKTSFLKTVRDAFAQR